jgi:hypothetical protein
VGSNPTPPNSYELRKPMDVKNLSAFSLQANRELADRTNLDYRLEKWEGGTQWEWI